MRKLTHDEISVNRQTLDTLNAARKLPVVVVLDNIRSNYNVGSIFRTSDGALIEKLIMTGFTPHPPKKEILKTALGATESINWEYYQNPIEVVNEYKSRGYKISALELAENSQHYSELCDSDFPLVLIVGNEITGVSQNLLDLCDYALEIPQHGIKQSLNVSVAYGISIFELRKIFDSK